jgi:hypothetical protein
MHRHTGRVKEGCGGSVSFGAVVVVYPFHVIADSNKRMDEELQSKGVEIVSSSEYPFC